MDMYSEFRRINNRIELLEETKIEMMAQLLATYSQEQFDLIKPLEVTMQSASDVSLGRLLTIAKGRADMYRTEPDFDPFKGIARK